MNIQSYLLSAPISRVAIGVLLSVIAFGCIKNPLKPITPASDIQMSIPIIDRTRTVADLFSKDTSKIKQNASGYYYEDDRSFNPASIDTIKVTPQPGSNQVALGKVTLAGLPQTMQDFTASQLGVPTGPVPGPPAPDFPAQSVSIPGFNLPANSQFEWMAVYSGTVSLTVTNTMPLQVTFPSGISLKNNSSLPFDTTTIAYFDLGTVDSGATKTVTVPLDGRLIYSAMKSDSIRFTTNQRSGPFTINSSDGLSFSFSSSNLTVDSARAIVPPGTQLAAISDSTIVIDPTAVLQQATFNSGLFSASLVNNTGLTVGARLKFNNFVSTKPSLDTLIIDQVIPPHGSYTIDVALDTIQLVNGQSISNTSMTFSASISTLNSGGGMVTFTSNDFVGASFTPQQQFVVSSLTGKMNPLNVNVNSGVALAGLGDASKSFSGSFDFDSISIALKVGLSSGYPIYHNLTLYAVNHKVFPNTFDSLVVPPGTVPVGLTTPGVITLDNSSGLSAFLSKAVFGDTMYVHGNLTVNPNLQSGTIYDTSKVYPSMSMYIPLKLGLLGGQYTDVVSISGKFDSSFVADTKSGSLRFAITNDIPLALTFRAAFMGTDPNVGYRDTLIHIPQDGSFYDVAGAQVDNSGSVTGPSTSTFAISLVEQEIQELLNCDSVYVKFTVNTSGSLGPPVQPVRISSSNYINLRASATMTYTVNKKKN